MERTLSVNYPVLRQNKGVLLNTFVKNHSHYIHFCKIYLSIAFRIDVQCCKCKCLSFDYLFAAQCETTLKCNNHNLIFVLEFYLHTTKNESETKSKTHEF